MAWVERRGNSFRVRYRNPDGSVGTDSSHPTRGAAEIRCKQVDVDQALDTYLDPAAGRITLASMCGGYASSASRPCSGDAD